MSEQALADRHRLEVGGALVAGGAATWLVTGVLALVGLLALMSALGGSFNQTILEVVGSGAAYVVAFVTLVIGSILLAAGLLVYVRGTVGLRAMDPISGQAMAISDGARTKARRAAILFLAYGVSAAVGLLLLWSLMNIAAGSTVQGLRDGFILLLVNWTASSILLVGAGSLLGSFLRQMRRETRSPVTFGGAGVLAYAIVNLVGVLFITGPFLSILVSPSATVGGTPPSVLILVLGVFLEVLVLPILGIAIFSFLIRNGLRLRRAQIQSAEASPIPAAGAATGPTT